MKLIKKSILVIFLAILIASKFDCHVFAIGNAIQQQYHLSSEAYHYLEEALSYMEQGSIHSQHIDWHSLKNEVYKQASNTQVPYETYDAIRLALSLLKDNHSFFLTPQQAQFLENKSDLLALETFQSKSMLINDCIGYLLIPPFNSLSPEAIKEYALNIQQEIRSLDKHNLNKWIVDLRGNSGGNMWPMVMGLQPLIGDGIFGYFSDGSGNRYAWNYGERSARIEDFEMCSLDATSYQLVDSQPWVAVLVDHETGSSGEATTVAFLGREKTRLFGQKSGGYTSANEAIKLSDGAMILLATTYLADRLGRIYQNEITPDEMIASEGDEVLNAALHWLEEKH